MKLFTKAAIIAIGLVVAMPATSAAEPVKLIPSIVIQGDYVRVGDIFENAGEAADDVIARTPLPGKDVVLDAYWLSKVARKFDVDWQPVSRQDRSLLRRDSRNVERSEIQNSIARSLGERGLLDGKYEVLLSTTRLELHVPSEAPEAVRVRDIAFDKHSGRFSAVIVAPPNSPQAVTVQVSGRVHSVNEIPVLAHRVAPDTVIRSEDIEWIRVRSDRVSRNIVVDAKNLIGKTPRRPLHPGRAIRVTDVQQPVLVEKGSLVIMAVQHVGMRLTARGKAMDSGGIGDTVRIANVQSRAIVEATVTGAGQVAVTPHDKIVLN